MINTAQVSCEKQLSQESKRLAEINIADIMRFTLDILMETRENANVTYKTLLGDTRPDPEMSSLTGGGSMIEMLDDLHSIARDILQIVVVTKNGLGIDNKN